MISIKNEHELEAMREACKITAAARALAGEMVRPGVSTKAIDQAVHDYIVSQGAKPSFLNYSGYPASACISVNSTVMAIALQPMPAAASAPKRRSSLT